MENARDTVRALVLVLRGFWGFAVVVEGGEEEGEEVDCCGHLRIGDSCCGRSILVGGCCSGGSTEECSRVLRGGSKFRAW
jgi:hypothetical protein